MSADIDWLETIDRAVQEVDALQAIYQDDDSSEDAAIRLFVKSSTQVESARKLVKSGDSRSGRDGIPTLELEMLVRDDGGEDDIVRSARLYFALLPGYPSHKPAKVTVLTTEGLERKTREELARQLQEKAAKFTGVEAVMGLTQKCQERLIELRVKALQKTKPEEACPSHSLLGRRWIWVHHIKDRQRKQDIVREALDRGLGGCLKAGYPGIVVIEGPKQNCDEFVTWIKGNKSRPGGFGRQWGHHVRGELEIDSRKLSDSFVELEEDMGVLALLCREKDLENEFLKFVMQHG